MRSFLRDVVRQRPVWAKLSAGLVLAAVLAHGPAEAALSYSFYKITNNNDENLSSQLSLTIYGAGDPATAIPGTAADGQLGVNEVLFVVTNSGPIASNVTEFYIDDGTVVSGPTVFNSLTGSTEFSAVDPANPGNLPGGNTVVPAFVATSAFSADILNTGDGVAPGDAVGFRYLTTGGLNAIATAFADGSLRVGLHVRSIGTAGGSDGYVTGDGGGGPPQQVPEPGTLALLGLGLGLGLAGIATSRRRRQ